MSWHMKFTITDFAESPSIDLFLFQNWISAKKIITFTPHRMLHTIPQWIEIEVSDNSEIYTILEC